MYKCIIFDLDGTLLNTLADLADASNFALCQMNLATHEENEYKQFVGSGRTKLVERMLPPFARTEENIHQGCVLFDSYYEKHCIDKTAPYDGIIALLKKLKEQNILAAVVSNKPDQFATPMVKKYFGELICLTQGKCADFLPKPDPAVVNAVLDKLHLSASDCLYVGDSDVDIVTAHNVDGLAGCGVLWGFRTREELTTAGADFLAENTSELSKIIFG